MADASVVLTMRMKDEASEGIKNFGRTAESARIPATRFRYEMIAMGAALSSIGALISRIDSPATKMIANFLQITGAVMLTISSIAQMLPYLSSLVASLRNVAIMQSIVKALSGPAGWITLGLGLTAGAGAGYAINAATSRTTPSGVVVNNYVQGSVVTERQIAETTRRQIVESQSRNAGRSGIE